MTTATDLETVDVESPDATPPLTVDITTFNLATHDATITLVSPRTGDHRTLRIRTVKRARAGKGDPNDPSKWEGKRLLELLIGPDNTGDFQPFAFVQEDGRISVWKRFRSSEAGPYVGRSVHEVLADMLSHPAYWVAKGVTYTFALHCRRCGRLLTHPSSLASGLGPICEGRE